jgi:hypothetical protein
MEGGAAAEAPAAAPERATAKVNWEDIQLVQKLIERCLELYMSQQEIVNALKMQANIEPGLTNLGACSVTPSSGPPAMHTCRPVTGPSADAVWEKLQEQNPDFFRAYRTRLRVKGQIREFNALVSKMSSDPAPEAASAGGGGGAAVSNA